MTRVTQRCDGRHIFVGAGDNAAFERPHYRETKELVWWLICKTGQIC